MNATEHTGTSDRAVRDATGRGPEEWFAVLDAWGGAERRHGEIVDRLTAEHGVAHWWAQNLTVGYERARGLRPPGGGRDGTNTAGASRTIAAPLERLFEAIVEPGPRERWLPGGPLRERTSRPLRSARFDWGDGATRVHVYVAAKGEARSHVAVSHERLPTAEARERRKADWRERLDALGALLEG